MQDQTLAEKPGGGLPGPRRAKGTKSESQRSSRDRKTGSEPDVLFNTRDDTVSAVSKSAPQVKVAKGTKGLRHPPGAPPSDPVTSLLPSGTDSEQGSRNSGESYVPTPQNSGSIPVSSFDPDTPAYREFREEDSLIGRRVDRSLADAAEQEGWRPGPDRKEPAKKQKQNDLKKKLEAKDALLEEEKKSSAELRVDLERARAYLQSRLRGWPG